MAISKLRSNTNIAHMLDAVASIETALNNNPIENDKLYNIITQNVSQITQEFKMAYERVKYESDLADFDNKRDTLVRSFFNILESFSNYFDADVLKAHAIVANATKELSSTLAAETHGEESVKIHQLLNILDTTEIKTTLEMLLPLPELISRLKVAQGEFEVANQNWAQSKGEDKKTPTDIKREVLFVINQQLVPLLNLGFIIDYNTYKTIAGSIESFINKANSMTD